MSLMTGAELTIHLLENQGVKCISGLPGGSNLPLYDALAKSKRIRHILARHEQGAAFIAQGIARTTDKPAVCFATSGPGATNTLTAIADAHLDSVPLVCITGQVPANMMGTDAFQEVDIYGMSIPITKHNFLVRSVEEIITVIPEAFRIAASGRPGPVLVDIPKNIQLASIEVDTLPEPGLPDAPITPDINLVKKAAALYNQAQRPLIYLGGGAATPEAAKLALQLAESQQTPVSMSLQGLGSIPAKHELSLGLVGMHGSRHTNMLLGECDFLLVLGARFGDRTTGRMDMFCAEANVVHVDIDPSELGKLRQPHIGVVSDTAELIKSLLPMLNTSKRENWVERVKKVKKEFPLVVPGEKDPCTPYGIIRCTASLLDDSAIITTDVGQHQMRTAQAYPLSRTRQWLTSGGLGTMGFGLPAAIGAALANPEATVVCFTGDGSLMMNLQELATAAEENVNVKVVLCNNNALGLVQQLQELFFGGRIFATNYSHHVDFSLIAKGFGIPSVNLSESAEPMKDLEKALHTHGSQLIQIYVKAVDKVFPIVPPGSPNSEMIGGEANDSDN